jgi:hypothetical protein
MLIRTNCGGFADRSLSKGRSKCGALMIDENIHLRGMVDIFGEWGVLLSSGYNKGNYLVSHLVH